MGSDQIYSGVLMAHNAALAGHAPQDGWQVGSLLLRPCSAADAALVEQIYAASRDEEMRQTGWPAAQQQAFLRSQCALQAAHYAAHYPGAHFCLVQRAAGPWGQALDEVPGEALGGAQATAQRHTLGRIYWHWQGLPGSNHYALHLMDLTLLPQHRGQGLAGVLLRALQEQAQYNAARMTLHVQPHSPAQAVYQHLGFVPVPGATDEGLYLRMQWAAMGQESGRQTVL